jgi:hypothetical protein
VIISGGSRSNWRFFAKHLTNGKDNDRVELAEVRGLAADNVMDALREMDALASGTRCKNAIYHADINPREDEVLTPEQWEQAVDLLERNLGLEGHSRFVVEHEKEGRVHRHVIWSRVDTETMTVVSDSNNYAKHERTARTLEKEFGHEAVRNAVTREPQEKRPERRAKNWERFRGNKSQVDPEQVKAEVTAIWQECDSGTAFTAALRERGYQLCKGDKRDFCIVDPAGQEHSLARRIAGAKAAEIRARLSDIDRDSLPTVEEGRKGNTGGGDTEGHRRLRRMRLDKEMQPYLQDRENPNTDETDKAARRAQRAKQRRERRASLLNELRIARASSMASRDALQTAVSGASAGYSTTEARERAAHASSLRAEMQPYVTAARQGRELEPPGTFFQRASDFMRRAARESMERAREVADRAKESWVKYVESRAAKDRGPERER